jgi:hypothetical protein
MRGQACAVIPLLPEDVVDVSDNLSESPYARATSLQEDVRKLIITSRRRNMFGRRSLAVTKGPCAHQDAALVH